MLILHLYESLKVFFNLTEDQNPSLYCFSAVIIQKANKAKGSSGCDDEPRDDNEFLIKCSLGSIIFHSILRNVIIYNINSSESCYNSSMHYLSYENVDIL